MNLAEKEKKEVPMLLGSSISEGFDLMLRMLA